MGCNCLFKGGMLWNFVWRVCGQWKCKPRLHLSFKTNSVYQLNHILENSTEPLFFFRTGSVLISPLILLPLRRSLSLFRLLRFYSNHKPLKALRFTSMFNWKTGTKPTAGGWTVYGQCTNTKLCDCQPEFILLFCVFLGITTTLHYLELLQ